MRKSYKALSLVETMIAICVASMLLIGLGTAFYMFRSININAIEEAKKDINISSVKDYVTSNINSIVREKVGKYYFTVDSENIETSEYELYIFDGKFYLVNSVKPTFLNGKDPVGSLGSIIVLDKDGNLAKTINGKTIVAFETPEYRNGLPFFLVDRNGDQILLHDIVEKMDETGLNNIAPEEQVLGSNIYYSETYKESDVFNGLFLFKNGTLYVNDNDILFGEEYIEEDGKKYKPIFKDLPYDVFDVNLTIGADNFTLNFEDCYKCNQCGYIYNVEELDSSYVCPVCGGTAHMGFSLLHEAGQTIASYGIRAKTNNQNYGVAYVMSSDPDSNYVVLKARECIYFGDDVDGDGTIDDDPSDDDVYYSGGEDDDISDTGDDGGETIDDGETDGDDTGDIEDYDDIGKGLRFSHCFEGWYKDGVLISTDYELYVSELPEDGSIEEYEARFSDDLTLADERSVLQENTISEEYRYSIVTKDIYLVNCEINYHRIAKSTSEEEPERKIKFVAGMYYKYFPEIFYN